MDCAKFFAILFMICVHVYEQISKFDYMNTMPDRLFRNVIEFLGGPMAAPVFMYCMGLGIVYSRHNGAVEMIKRGFRMLLMGYILNFLRMTLPLLVGMLLGVETEYSLLVSLTIVDILQFAGLAFITIGLMKKLNLSGTWMCVISLALQAAGIWATRLKIESELVQNLVGLLLPGGYWVGFPMFQWLIYPVLGMLFAEQLRMTEDKVRLYRKLTIASATVFVTYTAGLLYAGFDLRQFYELYQNVYYNQTLVYVIWTLPLVLLLLGGCFFLLRGLEKTKAGKLISFCSTNLTTIYFIQWLVIAYAVAVMVVRERDGTDSPFVIFGVAIAVMILSVWIASLIRKIKTRKAQRARTE